MNGKYKINLTLYLY